MVKSVRVSCVIAFLLTILMTALLIIGAALNWYQNTVGTGAAQVITSYNITGVKTTGIIIIGAAQVQAVSGFSWYDQNNAGNIPNEKVVFQVMGAFVLMALFCFVVLLLIFICTVIPGVQRLVRGTQGRVAAILLSVFGGIFLSIAALVLLRMPAATLADYNAQVIPTPCITGPCTAFSGNTAVLGIPDVWGPAEGWIIFWIVVGLDLLVAIISITSSHMLGYTLK